MSRFQSFSPFYCQPQTLQVTNTYDTGVDVAKLRKIGTIFSSTPDGFNLHKQLERGNLARRHSIEKGAADARC